MRFYGVKAVTSHFEYKKKTLWCPPWKCWKHKFKDFQWTREKHQRYLLFHKIQMNPKGNSDIKTGRLFAYILHLHKICVTQFLHLFKCFCISGNNSNMSSHKCHITHYLTNVTYYRHRFLRIFCTGTRFSIMYYNSVIYNIGTMNANW